MPKGKIRFTGWAGMDETKSVILEEPWIEAQMPIGWRIEQTGHWYVAFLGDQVHTQPYTTLVAAIERAWTLHNGTGKPQAAVAAKFAQARATKEMLRQMSIDDLL